MPKWFRKLCGANQRQFRLIAKAMGRWWDSWYHGLSVCGTPFRRSWSFFRGILCAPGMAVGEATTRLRRFLESWGSAFGRSARWLLEIDPNPSTDERNWHRSELLTLETRSAPGAISVAAAMPAVMPLIGSLGQDKPAQVKASTLDRLAAGDAENQPVLRLAREPRFIRSDDANHESKPSTLLDTSAAIASWLERVKFVENPFANPLDSAQWFDNGLGANGGATDTASAPEDSDADSAPDGGGGGSNGTTELDIEASGGSGGASMDADSSDLKQTTDLANSGAFGGSPIGAFPTAGGSLGGTTASFVVTNTGTVTVIPGTPVDNGADDGPDTVLPYELPPDLSALAENLPQLDIRFEQNVGQSDNEDTYFITRNAGYGLHLNSDGATFVLAASVPTPGNDVEDLPESPVLKLVKMSYVGANAVTPVAYGEALSDTTNYIFGDNPENWLTGVQSYSGVIYHDLYEGIDLLYYKNEAGQLEYDYLVDANADTSQIRLQFEGADGVSIDDAGNLVIHTAYGDLQQQTPYLYQDINGVRNQVSGSFEILDNGEVGFALGDYSIEHALVIDPILSYSSNLGGSSQDWGQGIARGSDGALYLTGYTFSSNFPTQGPYDGTHNGNFDVYVTKLSADGSQILYSTFVGGSQNDYAFKIAVNGSGEAHVVGATLSTGFPTTSGAYDTTSNGTWDAYLFKLNAAGNGLSYSTFLGGSGADFARDLAIRSNGNVVLVGHTTSNNFPTKEAYQSSRQGSADAFVTELQLSGSGSSDLVFSTFLGSTGTDAAYGVTLDSAGKIYVAGEASANFPTTAGAYQTTNGGGLDAFIAKLTHSSGNNVTRDFVSYLGGSGTESAYGVALDSSDRPYITGFTTSTSGIATNGSLQDTYGGGTFDGFVARFADDGSGLEYGTYLGSSGDEISYAVAVLEDHAYVTGYTSSTDYHRVDALQWGLAGDTDIFVTKIAPDGASASFSTVLGGSGGDQGWDILVDAQGTMHLTGFSQENFPQAGAIQGFAGSSDAIVVSIRDSLSNVQQNDPTQSTSVPIGDGFTKINLLTGDLHTDIQIDCGCGQGVGAPFSWSSLHYNSGTVDPRPVITTKVVPLAGDTIDEITVILTWDYGGANETTVTRTVDVTGSGPYIVGVRAPSGFDTGYYAWKTEVSYETVSSMTVPLRDSFGSAYIVNNSASAIGPGWSVGTVDRLVDVDDGQGNAGLLWISGATGYARFFREGANNTYRSPGNDFGELVKNGNGTFTYTAKNQHKINFDSSGKITSVVAPGGKLTRTFTYDGSGNIQTITLPGISTATFTYSGGFLTQVESPRGTVVINTRDGDNNPTSVTMPDGNDRDMTYALFTGNVEKLLASDPWGPLDASYDYDEFGGIKEVDRGLGSVTQYESQNSRTQEASAISESENHALITDAMSEEWKYKLDESGRLRRSELPDGGTYVTERDFAGQVELSTDPLDRTTTFTYAYGASKGDLNKITRADGTVESFQYSATFHYVTVYQDSLGRRTTNTYDADSGDLLTVRDALNQVTTYTYVEDAGIPLGLVETIKDALGRVTTNVWDTTERHLTATIDALGNRTSYTYDDAGNVETVKDALGRVTTTIYDDMRRPTQVIDALGQITTFVYNAIGQVTSMTDPLGRTMTYAYDQRGLLVSMTEAVGTSEQRRTTYTYDVLERLATQVDPLGHVMTYSYDEVGRMRTTTDPVGAVLTYNYDLAGQMTSMIDPRGNQTTFVYDSRGRQTATIDALDGRATTTYDAESNVIETRDELGRRTTFTYDALNRQVTRKDALGGVMTTAYDAVGNVTGMQDELGRRTTLTYDAINRQTEVKDALGNTITAVYDAVSNVKAMVDQLGRRTTFSYDSLNRQAEMQDALGNRATTVYDAVGNVTASVDQLGRRTTLTYDALNRQTEVKDALGNVATTIYDKASNVVAVVDRRGNRTSFVYDNADRQIEMKDALGNVSSTVYDLAGNVIASVDERGNRTSFTYDALNRQVTQKNAHGDVMTMSYDKVGNVTAMQDELGRITTLSYDALNRQVEVQDALGNRATSVYDAVGNLTTSIDQLGRRTTFTYDVLNRQTEVKDALGNSATMVYDAVGNMTVSVDQLGRRTTLTYDVLNRATEAKDALGNTATMVYDAVGNMTASVDQLGRRTTVTYDVLNRQTEIRNALNGVATTVYDATSNVVATVDELGNRTTFSYDALNRQFETTDALGNLTTIVFDAAGNASAMVDERGNRTSFTYDALNRQITRKNTLGDVMTTTYDKVGNVTAMQDELGRVTTLSYDALNRQVEVQDALGSRATSVFDAVGNLTTSIDQLGRRTTFTYDVLNRQTEVKDALGNTATLIFDAVGNVTASIDQLGRRTTFTFDVLNRLTEVKDALGNTATTIYDAVGNVTASVNEIGNRTTFTFDALNRQTEVKNPLSNVMTMVYDAFGNMIASVDERGNRTSFMFDALNRQVEVEDALGEVSTTVYDAASNVSAMVDQSGNRTTFTYDALNRQETVKDAAGNVSTTVYDKVGNVTVQVDQLGHRTTYAYDGLNRETTMTRPTGGVMTTVYDAVGNTVNTIDPVGNKTTFVFDALNRQTEVIDARGGITTSIYDAVGNTVNVIDPVGNKTTFVFDALNRQVNEIDPLGATITMVYDAASRMTQRVDRNGRAKEFAYDTDDRLLTETWKASVGGATVNVLTFTYDASDNLLTAKDSDGTVTMTYDALNRAASQVDVWGKALTFTYDATSNRTVVADSEGGLETSTYDSLNRLTRREYTGQSTQLRLDQTYTPRSELQSQTRYSDLAGANKVGSTSYTYDATGRLTNLQHRDGAFANIANFTHTYDLADRLTTEQLNGGAVKTYTYDATNQLTDDSTSAYSYDLNGNRDPMPGYDIGAGNRLLSDGTWDYEYDNGAAQGEGNRTGKNNISSDETWSYVYDHDNHLIGVEQRDASTGGNLLMRATYVYDALGHRVAREAWTSLGGNQTERYSNDGSQIWADLNDSSSLTTRYVIGDQVLERFARVTVVGDTFWLLPDRLGSVRDVVDEGGVQESHLDYDGFGNLTASSGLANAGDYRYAGYRLDPFTELMGADSSDRDLASDTGTWQTEDRQRGEDTNPYRYVANNTPNATDPYGTELWAWGESSAQNAAAWLTGNTGSDVKGPRGPGIGVQIIPSKRGYPGNDPDRKNGAVRYRIVPNSLADWSKLKAYADANKIALGSNTAGTQADMIVRGLLDDRVLTTVWWGTSNNYRVEQDPDLISVHGLGRPNVFDDPIVILATGGAAAIGRGVVSAGASKAAQTVLAGQLTKETAKQVFVQTAKTSAKLGVFAGVVQFGGQLVQVIEGKRNWYDLSLTEALTTTAIVTVAAPAAFLFPWTGPVLTVIGLGATTTQIEEKCYLSAGYDLVVSIVGPKILEYLGNKLFADIDGNPKPRGGRQSLPMVKDGQLCFAAGTPLLTATGHRNVEDFCVGDTLLSRSESDPDGRVEEKAVEAVFVRSGPIVNVHLHGKVIRTTAEHPFYLKNSGWIRAASLQSGDQILGHDGRWTIVDEVYDTEEWEPVYNLRVADYHTYFVGSAEWGFSVWAHNNNQCIQIHQEGVGQAKRYVLRDAEGNRVRNKRGDLVDPFVSRDEARAWAEANGMNAQDIFTKPPLAKPAWTNELVEATPVPKLSPDGKWHGEVPPRIPNRWGHKDRQKARDAVEDSVRRRRQANLEKGLDPNHDERLTDEDAFLQMLNAALGPNLE